MGRDGDGQGKEDLPVTANQRLTWLCYGSMMALAVGMNLLPVFLSSLSVTFGGAKGLSSEQLGRLGAATFLGLVVGILISGALADRFGAKVFAQVGNLLTVICLALMAVAPNYFSLMTALFFLGIGAGMLDMILSPVVAALNPDHRAAAMNWLHSFYSVGAAFTILEGMLALRGHWGWRTACFALIPLPLLLIVGFSAMRFPEMGEENSVPIPLSSLARSRWFRLAVFAILLGGATELGMAQWLPDYAEVSLGFPAWVGAVALLAFSVAMTLGRMVAGYIGGRVNPFRLMAWGCGASVFLFLTACFIRQPYIALGAGILVGFTGSPLWPTVLAVTANRYPEGGTAMYCALTTFGNAGGIFMPWLVGWVADRSTLPLGVSVSALAPLIMIPIVLAMGHRPQRGVVRH